MSNDPIHLPTRAIKTARHNSMLWIERQRQEVGPQCWSTRTTDLGHSGSVGALAQNDVDPRARPGV